MGYRRCQGTLILFVGEEVEAWRRNGGLRRFKGFETGWEFLENVLKSLKFCKIVFKHSNKFSMKILKKLNKFKQSYLETI